MTKPAFPLDLIPQLINCSKTVREQNHFEFVVYGGAQTLCRDPNEMASKDVQTAVSSKYETISNHDGFVDEDEIAVMVAKADVETGNANARPAVAPPTRASRVPLIGKPAWGAL
ncbi:unnamed protein product [Pieris macdunnoughi]|uniref:Uncharacterized protein n=1 Tax=Pieris macdunnoughi TaxID=345717 RepID=A0A821R3I6_9NEOP|nr:unnamed protein product [Pieris macdunnoughi]